MVAASSGQRKTHPVPEIPTARVRVTPTQIQGLLESVRGGTGSVALHSGNTTFWNSPEYLRMLGSRWIDHDEIKRFSVHIEQPSNPVVAGVTDFEIEDELLEIGGDTSKFTEFTDAFCERAGRQTSSGSAPGRCSPT